MRESDIPPAPSANADPKSLGCGGPTGLDAAPSPVYWYHSPLSLIVSFLTVGPFMLPLVWTHPKMSRNAKAYWSTAIVLVTGALAAGTYKALASIFQYYDMMLGL